MSQEGKCAICKIREEDLPKSDWHSDEVLHIDHDHVLGNVRGLLCKNCNYTLEATLVGCTIIHPGHRGFSKPSKDHRFAEYMYSFWRSIGLWDDEKGVPKDVLKAYKRKLT